MLDLLQDTQMNSLEQFKHCKSLSESYKQINYEILKKARDRIEENLQKTENELYDLKKVTSKLNKQNHVLERRLRNNQTQMKELLLCDQKRTYFFLPIFLE